MFYFDEINGKKILKSTFFDEVELFFTTRELPISPGALNIQAECETKKAEIAK